MSEHRDWRPTLQAAPVADGGSDGARVSTVFEAFAIAAGAEPDEADRIRRVGRALADASRRTAEGAGQPPSPRG